MIHSALAPGAPYPESPVSAVTVSGVCGGGACSPDTARAPGHGVRPPGSGRQTCPLEFTRPPQKTRITQCHHLQPPPAPPGLLGRPRHRHLGVGLLDDLDVGPELLQRRLELGLDPRQLLLLELLARRRERQLVEPLHALDQLLVLDLRLLVLLGVGDVVPVQVEAGHPEPADGAAAERLLHLVVARLDLVLVHHQCEGVEEPPHRHKRLVDGGGLLQQLLLGLPVGRGGRNERPPLPLGVRRVRLQVAQGRRHRPPYERGGGPADQHPHRGAPVCLHGHRRPVCASGGCAQRGGEGGGGGEGVSRREGGRKEDGSHVHLVSSQCAFLPSITALP
mmetsp:Transcript_4832/g.11553  ORF Transcript_4832/g.11553 Transcript_4832/m.11553 type:complete len:335 (+) Transcript_4832:30-1034(+)